MNVQVLFVDTKYSILTFCDSDRLFSLIQTVLWPPYDFVNYTFAEEIFNELSINVENIKDFSDSSMISANYTLVCFCAYCLIKNRITIIIKVA